MVSNYLQVLNHPLLHFLLILQNNMNFQLFLIHAQFHHLRERLVFLKQTITDINNSQSSLWSRGLWKYSVKVSVQACGRAFLSIISSYTAGNYTQKRSPTGDDQPLFPAPTILKTQNKGWTSPVKESFGYNLQLSSSKALILWFDGREFSSYNDSCPCDHFQPMKCLKHLKNRM